MCDRSGEFTDCCNLRGARHLHLQIAYCLRGSFKLRCGQPMLGHVHLRADDLDEFAGFVSDRLTNRVLKSNGAVWEDDAIGGPILGLLAEAPCEMRLNSRTVLRVNPVEPKWRS